MQYLVPFKLDGTPEASWRADRSAPAYDLRGQLLFQHSMDAGDRWMLPDAAGQPLYAWDVNDRQPDEGATVLEQRLFETGYDALRRPLAQELTINGVSAVVRRWVVQRWVYGESMRGEESAVRARNLRGQVHEVYDPSGLTRNVAFDFKGNLLEVERNLTRPYDAPVVGWEEGFDRGQLETETTFRKVTEYDALGRITRLFNWHRAPDRVVVYEPHYGERGLLSHEEIFLRASRGAREERIGGRSLLAVSGLRYNARGQREHVRYGNGTITRHAYDPQTFRLTQIRTTRPDYDPSFPDYQSGLRDERVLQQLYYTYDAAGNITEIRDDAYEPVFFRNQEVNARSLYMYDPLHRLIEATGREDANLMGPPPQRPGSPAPVDFPLPGNPKALRNYTQSYRYDRAGNIREMRHSAGDGSWTRTYEYALDSNRLQWTEVGDNGVSDRVDYRYDTHGSMLNLDRAPEKFQLRWDFRDMIRSIDLEGGGWAYYSYDAEKQRTRKAIHHSRGGALQWERLYVGGMELYRDDHRQEIETHHVFVGDERILLIHDVINSGMRSDAHHGNLFRYQFSDHLRSVRFETDGGGRIISWRECHPYGATAFFAETRAMRAAGARYSYAGMERDEETGLDYCKSRQFFSWLGRWCSADPGFMIDGLNLYGYARENPIRFSDVSGRQALDAETRRLVELVQSTVDEIPQDEFPDLPRQAQGTNAHATLEFQLWSLEEDSLRIAPEVVVDLDSGEVLGWSVEPGQAGVRSRREGRRLRTIDVAILQDGVTRDSIVGRRASDVIELTIDYKFPRSGMREVSQLERATRAPYIAMRKGDTSEEVVARAERRIEEMARSAIQRAVDQSEALPASGSRSVTRTIQSIIGAAASDSRVRRILLAIPVIDVFWQQFTYEDSAYTGDRPLDAVLNLTVSESWEIPMGIYSAAELVGAGVISGVEGVVDLGRGALDAAVERLEPIVRPIESGLWQLYGF